MKKYGSLTKLLVEISRIIVGATFAFSGFVKMVDPLGFTYKIQDYLIAWNFLDFFPLALPVAVFLSALEFLLGIFLLLGIWRKWSTLFIFALMLFMTPLTLWVALENPVADCGCFGDAFIISNWETFYKNIVLITLSVLLCFQWRLISPFYSKRYEWMPAFFSIAFAILFAMHNVFRVQVFDFRPYKVGASISGKMVVNPEKSDVYNNFFIYEKEGKQQKFTEDDYPWNDSTWTFVEMKTELVKKGETPEIEDFFIVRLDYNDSLKQYEEVGDITQDVLTDSRFVFLMTSYSLEKARKGSIADFSRVADFAKSHNFEFYCLTSTSTDDILKWSEFSNTTFPFCHADERVLKTMNRSNPGLMLLKDGIVVQKWDNLSIPSNESLEKQIAKPLPTKETEKQNNRTTFLLIMAIFLLPLGALKWIDCKFTTK